MECKPLKGYNLVQVNVTFSSERKPKPVKLLEDNYRKQINVAKTKYEEMVKVEEKD